MLGRGRKLFTNPTQSGFNVAECRATPSGMVLLTVTKDTVETED